MSRSSSRPRWTTAARRGGPRRVGPPGQPPQRPASRDPIGAGPARRPSLVVPLLLPFQCRHALVRVTPPLPVPHRRHQPLTVHHPRQHLHRRTPAQPGACAGSWTGDAASRPGCSGSPSALLDRLLDPNGERRLNRGPVLGSPGRLRKVGFTDPRQHPGTGRLLGNYP